MMAESIKFLHIFNLTYSICFGFTNRQFRITAIVFYSEIFLVYFILVFKIKVNLDIFILTFWQTWTFMLTNVLKGWFFL